MFTGLLAHGFKIRVSVPKWCQSMFLFSRVPFWVPIFDPQPNRPLAQMPPGSPLPGDGLDVQLLCLSREKRKCPAGEWPYTMPYGTYIISTLGYGSKKVKKKKKKKTCQEQ